VKLKSVILIILLFIGNIVFAEETRISDPEKQYYRTVKLSTEEDSWLKEHRTLRVGLGDCVVPISVFGKW